MPKLSNAQIANIFAIYLNCDMVDYLPGSTTPVPSTKRGLDVLSDYLHNIAYPSFTFSQKLVLTRPEHLTYTQILDLCKAVCPGIYGDYRYAGWTIKKHPNWGEFFKNVEVSNKHSEQVFDVDLIDGEVRIYDGGELEPSDVNHHYWQWYFANGVAIPLYPWNQTAIELDVAIEKPNTKPNAY